MDVTKVITKMSYGNTEIPLKTLNLQEKSVDPTTSAQEVVPDEQYGGLSKVKVEAVDSTIDENITPNNIRSGVKILGVEGSLESVKPEQEKTVTPSTQVKEVVADEGFELKKVLVEAVTSDVDPNIAQNNIKQGVTILGVTGNLATDKPDQTKTTIPTKERQIVRADTGYELTENIVEPIPDEYEIPVVYDGALEVTPTTENQTLETAGKKLSGNVVVNAVNPSDYYKDEEIVNVTPSTESQKITPTANKVFNEVNVSPVTSAIDSNILANNIKKDVTILGVTGTLEQGGAEDLTAELTAQDTALTNLESAVDKLPEPKKDRLQWKCDNMKTLEREFYGYKGTSLDEVLTGLDTSKVTNMKETFYGCEFTTIPLIDTSNVTNMSVMFKSNSKLTTVPLLNTGNVTNMYTMFEGCHSLVNVPNFDTKNVTNMGTMFQNCAFETAPVFTDTSKVTDMSNMFISCKKLKTIPLLNMISVTNNYNIFAYSPLIENITLKNIKISLQIGSGTSYGTLLTDESLINTAQELWDMTGSTSKTLTVSTPSNARLDAIYVKLIEATADMIANDEHITNKKPCVVCESTDEGAMTLREYVLSKNWSIA